MKHGCPTCSGHFLGCLIVLYDLSYTILWICFDVFVLFQLIISDFVMIFCFLIIS